MRNWKKKKPESLSRGIYNQIYIPQCQRLIANGPQPLSALHLMNLRILYNTLHVIKLVINSIIVMPLPSRDDQCPFSSLQRIICGLLK